MDQSILLKIYRGEYAPYRRKDQNSSSYDKLMALQEEILAALPEEKRPLMDSVQDEINTLTQPLTEPIMTPVTKYF